MSVCACVCVSGGCSEASAQEKGTTAAFISLASCSAVYKMQQAAPIHVPPHAMLPNAYCASSTHTHTLTFTLHAGTIRKHTTHL